MSVGLILIGKCQPQCTTRPSIASRGKPRSRIKRCPSLVQRERGMAIPFLSARKEASHAAAVAHNGHRAAAGGLRLFSSLPFIDNFNCHDFECASAICSLEANFNCVVCRTTEISTLSDASPNFGLTFTAATIFVHTRASLSPSTLFFLVNNPFSLSLLYPNPRMTPLKDSTRLAR